MRVADLDVPVSPDYAEDALRELRRRVPLTDAEMARLEAAEERHAFWVSGVTQADLVADVLAAIDDSLASGEGFAAFKKRVGAQLAEAWGGADALRLDTVYDANVQGAYAAGRWRQMTEPGMLAARPHWRFRAVLDSRTTPGCRALDGATMEATDARWGGKVPPRHFRCRSYIETLTVGEAVLSKEVPVVHTPDGWGQPPPDVGSDWKPNVERFPPEMRETLRRRLDL